jgi:hypothetical protein
VGKEIGVSKHPRQRSVAKTESARMLGSAAVRAGIPTVLMPPRGIVCLPTGKFLFPRKSNKLHQTAPRARADRRQVQSRTSNACILLPTYKCRTVREFLDLSSRFPLKSPFVAATSQQSRSPMPVKAKGLREPVRSRGFKSGVIPSRAARSANGHLPPMIPGKRCPGESKAKSQPIANRPRGTQRYRSLGLM